MTDRLRLPLLVLVGIALAALVSQSLPSSNPDRWSPVAVLLLGVAGAIAGLLSPTLRAWADAFDGEVPIAPWPADLYLAVSLAPA